MTGETILIVDDNRECRFTIDMLQLNKKRSREHSLVL